MTTSDAAIALHDRGLHVFPTDHPDHPKCTAAMAPTIRATGNAASTPP